MMQTHISMNNLEGPLVGKNVDLNITKEDNIFQDIGLDAAVMYSRIDKLTESTLESCCLTFPDTSLLLLPGTEIKNKETFERDICRYIFRMIHSAEQYVDIVMIDANSGNDDLSFKLMSSADLIIINLTQRRHVLNKLFQEYENRFNDYSNIFFLFGAYDNNSGYNINNCRRKYWKYINKNNSAVIPYSTKYMDAQNECNILKMIKEGLYTYNLDEASKLNKLLKSRFKLSKYKDEETNYFFNQSCQCALKIMNKLNTLESKTLIKRSGA